MRSTCAVVITRKRRSTRIGVATLTSRPTATGNHRHRRRVDTKNLAPTGSDSLNWSQRRKQTMRCLNWRSFLVLRSWRGRIQQRRTSLCSSPYMLSKTALSHLCLYYFRQNMHVVVGTLLSVSQRALYMTHLYNYALQ